MKLKKVLERVKNKSAEISIRGMNSNANVIDVDETKANNKPRKLSKAKNQGVKSTDNY